MHPASAQPTLTRSATSAGLSRASWNTERSPTGARKDFVDLAFLLDILTLSAMLDAHDRKYRTESRFAVLKSLVYFDDAEAEPMPPMLRPMDWTAIRRKVESAVRPWV